MSKITEQYSVVDSCEGHWHVVKNDSNRTLFLCDDEQTAQTFARELNEAYAHGWIDGGVDACQDMTVRLGVAS